MHKRRRHRAQYNPSSRFWSTLRHQVVDSCYATIYLCEKVYAGVTVAVAVGSVLQYAYASAAGVGVGVTGVSSKHRPNQPLVVHVVVVASVVVVDESVVVLSLQPNQPGCTYMISKERSTKNGGVSLPFRTCW